MDHYWMYVIVLFGLEIFCYSLCGVGDVFCAQRDPVEFVTTSIVDVVDAG